MMARTYELTVTLKFTLQLSDEDATLFNEPEEAWNEAMANVSRWRKVETPQNMMLFADDLVEFYMHHSGEWVNDAIKEIK